MRLEEMEWKTLQSQYLYEGRMKLRSDMVELPNKKRWNYVYLEQKPAVGIIPITNDGKLVMVRQYRYALRRFTWETPAGGMEEGEDPRECAIREIEEETGYRAGRLTRLISFNNASGSTTLFMHLFLAEDLVQTQQRLDESEFIRVGIFDLAEVVDKLESGELQTDAATSLGVLLAFRRFNQTK